MQPARFTDPHACVDDTLSRLGSRIVLATPLGLGKSVPLVNAFYDRARADPTIDLTITTALTLQPPHPHSDLQRRLLDPIVDRLFAGYPAPRWLEDQRRRRVPGNVRIREFFFQPGSRMNVPDAQRQYISENYTHVVRDLVASGVNVLAQMVSPGEMDGEESYSLSCNPDLTLDLLPYLREFEREGKPVAVLGQVNSELPYMFGDSELPSEAFHGLVTGTECEHRLFGTPNAPVTVQDYGIALHASCLIRDGGTLQLGIGAMGDAVTRLLQLRQEDNETYRQLLGSAGVMERFGGTVEELGGTGTFSSGLYAATEMLVDGYLALYRHGILRRRVYPHAEIQELLNAGVVNADLNEDFLKVLGKRGLISGDMGESAFRCLQELGVFPEQARFDEGTVTLDDGVNMQLDEPGWTEMLAPYIRGRTLRQGCVAHAGFFLGPMAFYESLAELPASTRREIHMTRISFVNELYGEERLKRAQRKDARFLNSGLMATLLGHVVSDGLEDGRIISGVGGQYNFVSMAHALEDGRSILMVRSTRGRGRRFLSNIVWNYGHVTIPRHLRDIIITEYGIADLRGCSDEECIRRMINVSDARFQESLMNDAKRAGKLARGYRVPDHFRNNTAEKLSAVFLPLEEQGALTRYPYGTDLDPEEIALAGALKYLDDHLRGRVLPAGWWRHLGSLVSIPQGAGPFLKRMGLGRPRSLTERVQRRVVALALALKGVI